MSKLYESNNGLMEVHKDEEYGFRFIRFDVWGGHSKSTHFLDGREVEELIKALEEGLEDTQWSDYWNVDRE